MTTKQGVLPSQEIRDLIQNGFIYVPKEYENQTISDSQIQPASVDLTLGNMFYHIWGRPTAEDLKSPHPPPHSYLYQVKLQPEGNVLVNNCTYLIPTREQFQNLPDNVRGYVNNKSSSGRINVQTKLTTQFCDDIIPQHHTGISYNRINAKLFPIKVHLGDTVNQIRFIYGNAEVDDFTIQSNQTKNCFLYDKTGAPITLTKKHLQEGLITHLDLETEIIGWKAKHHPSIVLDLSKRDYKEEDFWEKLKVNEHGSLLLEAGEFYILATKECISVPPQFALEMIPYNLTAGEFRSHYAGFFDPGFGWSKDESILGRPATLEVIPHENMFVRDGAVICKFKVERMRDIPDILYGDTLQSNYQHQLGPQLAKYFKRS